VKGRGEKAVSLWTDREGRLRLSPLLEWAVDDVWQYLGLANAGVIPAYSRFEETMQTYQAAGGSSCVVVADAEMQKHSKPCSSRFGCWVCTAVREDRSLRQMIETDRDRYGYMAPLAALEGLHRAFTQYDWSRRQYVGRSIVEGFIEVGADTYSPAMLADLLRYTLSAQKLSGVPIVSAAQLIAIDARWSQYAIAEPFSRAADLEAGRRRCGLDAALACVPYPEDGGAEAREDLRRRLERRRDLSAGDHRVCAIRPGRTSQRPADQGCARSRAAGR
jgi:DNA sulfur modification protein DndC